MDDNNINGLIIESEEMVIAASIDTTNKVTFDVLDQFCRLCGTAGDQSMAIFVNEGVEHQLLDKIREHLPMIEVAENDLLPSNVCYACASTLISWHELYHSCKDADTRLRNMIGNLKSNVADDILTESNDDDNFYSEDIPSNDDRCTGRETNSEERSTLVNKIECSLSSGNKLTENSEKLTDQEWQSNKTRITEASIKSRIDCYKCKRTFDCDAKWRAHYNEQRIICANLNVFHTYYNELKSQPLLPPDRINAAFEFACGQCEQRFAAKENLKMHIICFHPCVEKFRCDYCAVKFVTECDLADHRIEHSRCRNAVCTRCGGRIKIAGRSYETNQQQIMFEWCVCKKTIVNSADTIETRKKMITKPAGDDRGGKSVRVEIDLNTECSACDKRFKTPRLLRRHLSAHNNKEECDVCGKSYPKLYMKSHKLIHSSHKTFVCDTCGKKFAQCSSLRSHQLLEKNIKKYVCNVCGLQFVLNSRLHTHMKSHAETLPFKCQDCGRQYGYIWQLRQHRIRHSTERAFVCEICTRSFKTKRHLKQHFVVHYKGK